MDYKTYSDCELHYIDQGLDPARAAEECNSERESDEERGKFSESDKDSDEFDGEF